jgi:lantibiotic modifying enzyme
LIKYGAVRNKKDFIELGMEQINIENRYFCKEQGGWRDVRYPEEFVTFRYWCHGSAGILIARTKVKDILEHYNDSSKKRWIETIDHDIAFVNQQIMSGTFFEKNTNLGLCHGAAGQLDALLIMNKYMRIQELGRIAEEEKNIFLDELMNSSIKTGDPQIMDDEGFMNGVTGIAYEVLRILDPEIPAVLGLEI